MRLLLALLMVSVNIGLGPHWTACVSTGVLCAVFLFLLEAPARRLGFIDHPSGRKAHAVATPLTGGVAIILAYTVMACLGHASESHGAILAALLGVGLLDDRFGLSARMRLLAEAAAALMLVYYAGTGVADLGNLLGYGPIALGPLMVPFTVLVLVGLINAINMIDGLDGLAAGVSITSLGWMLAAVALAGASPPTGLPIMIAAIAGFLALNSRHPLNKRAVAFLGDSGSMVLGLCLGWYAITLSQGPDRVLTPASVLWILGLPVVDTLRVMFTRPLKRKRSPFAPGRDHFHHVLQSRGLSSGMTAWLIVAFNAAFGAVGVFGPKLGLSEPTMTYTFIGLASLFWFGIPSSRFIGECGTDISHCSDGICADCVPELFGVPKREVPALIVLDDHARHDPFPLASIEPDDTIIDVSTHPSSKPIPSHGRSDELKKNASRQ